MKDSVFVVLLIVNLLTCPLRCLACDPHATSSAMNLCAPCECCQHGQESPVSDPASDPEGDECGCKSCICEGAVVETPAEIPALGTGLIWLLPLQLGSPLRLHAGEFADAGASMHAGRMVSGRGARLAHRSWQI